MNGNKLLISAAVLSFLIAALHVVIIFIGAEGYRYFGAGEEMAQGDAAGSWGPALITTIITVFFILFGLYALSGAKVIRRLPVLKAALIVISAIFVLRGAGIIGDAYMMTVDPSYPGRMFVFSLVALITGLCFLLGTKKNWRNLSA
jgi:hypothetical protein